MFPPAVCGRRKPFYDFSEGFAGEPHRQSFPPNNSGIGTQDRDFRILRNFLNALAPKPEAITKEISAPKHQGRRDIRQSAGRERCRTMEKTVARLQNPSREVGISSPERPPFR
jgi:hypothetical protein